MIMKARLYLVEGPAGVSLVKATHPNHAIRHVSKGLFKCRLPSTIEVADLVARGVIPQVAGDENQPELSLDQDGPAPSKNPV